MKTLTGILILLSSLCCAVFADDDVDEKAKLDVLKMQEIPSGLYDVQLQYGDKKETVRLSIKNNRAGFVQGTREGLSGDFKLLANGVFFARLSYKAGGKSQWWIFHPDGSATVREIPDRGEKQTARPISE